MAKVIILSGAGISAESGISTFRGDNGLWNNHDVSVVCHVDSLKKNRDVTIEFYDYYRKELQDKKPNHAHMVIAHLKAKYPNDIAVITQNVDNLFEKAGLGEDDLIHLHGYLPELLCQNNMCELTYDIGYESLKSFNNGICPDCKSELRPNVVFFGEQAVMYAELNKEFSDCEMFVVIGTSGVVVPVTQFARHTKYSILNNLEKSTAINDNVFDSVIYDKATIAIDSIAKKIESFLDK